VKLNHSQNAPFATDTPSGSHARKTVSPTSITGATGRVITAFRPSWHQIWGMQSGYGIKRLRSIAQVTQNTKGNENRRNHFLHPVGVTFLRAQAEKNNDQKW
jgi:hypothetical protein